MTAIGFAQLEDLLPGLPGDALRQLWTSASLMNYRSGETIMGSGKPWSPGVILDGIARLSISSNAGRTASLGLVRRGAIVGLRALFPNESPHPWVEVNLSANDRTTVIAFEPDVFESLARQQCAFAMFLLGTVVDSSGVMADAAGRLAFMTVRERVAAQLLELASGGNKDSIRRVVNTTHQQLADSVGSAREVVSRILSEMRMDGILLRSSPAHVVILDTERLAAAAFGAP